MQRWLNLLGTGVLLAGVAACQGPIDARQQIVLPEGDAAKGEAAFVELECMACHKLRNREMPPPTATGPVTVVLGGNVSKVKSYGELVTSIVNPSHRLARNIPRQEIARDGESVMTVYNDVMTVTQLIDIVEFLQSQYDVVQRPGYRYPVYTY
jgi:hypothetical protein